MSMGDMSKWGRPPAKYSTCAAVSLGNDKMKKLVKMMKQVKMIKLVIIG